MAIGQPGFSRAQQRALEGQHGVAGMAGAFGKQHQRIAFQQAVADGIAGFAGGGAAGALDKDRALQPRQSAEERPARDF